MRDPKAIRKAIMTAKSVARLIDPHFGRVPLPEIGDFGRQKSFEEHSPMIHAVYGEPLPDHFAVGGDVEPYQDPETSHISEWNWRPLEDVRSDLGYMREIPSHVLKFGDFMDEIAQRAGGQGLTPRDLIKAYTITRSSIQRRAAKTDKVRQAGLPLDDFHDEMIRPEGAFGEWLHTAAGQAYLDAAEKGQVHHGAIQDAVRVMAPFGKHEKDIPDALSWAATHLPGNEKRVSELIHAGRLKASHPSEWRDFTSGIRGIGPSKSGFYASLLGRGDQPTLDARQIILHTGRPTKEATRFLSRKGGAGGVEAVNRLTARQEAMGLGIPERLSPYYQHLAHHAVWDQAGGDETTHEDVMRSMRHAASGGAIMPHEHWVGEILHRLDDSSAEHYADGGEVDDQHPYAAPNDLGLYSHAAVTAAGLPQERGTPEQFRGMLLNRGVKPTEMQWGEYDYAFGDKPEVTRDEVAKHFWVTTPGQIEEVKLHKNRGANRTPYHEEYTIPGGKDYREVLLKHHDEGQFEGNPHHFGGEGDILTSLRLKDRQDAEGKKLLHLEELQSDWAQQGRKGFKGTEIRAAEQALDDYLKDLQSRTGMDVQMMWPDAAREAAQSVDEDNTLLRLMGDAHAERQNNKSRPPEAPYVTRTNDWVDLGLKRALMEAAREGHDKLVWTPGDEQADRYDLSKHIREIRHEKNDDGTYNLDVMGHDGDRVYDREDIEAEELPGLVGKEMADKIMSGHGEKDEHPGYRDWRTLSGLDLKVGGEGMRKFYDELLPKRLMRLAKMHDPEAQFSHAVIRHPDQHYHPDEWEEGGYMPNPQHTSLPALEITPKMRESILKRGFPAFADGGKVEEHAEAYADGGDIDPELFKQYMKRIHSPLSEDSESVRKALQIAGSYRAPTGMETGVGSLYGIKQSMPASAVTRTIKDIPGVKLKPQKKGSWEDFYDLAKGNEFVNVGGDLSGFGRLTHINGKELAWPVDLHAGADYMREPNPGRVWANIGAHATGFQTKIREANERGKELYGILSPMGPSAVNSSHNMFDTLMAQIPNAEIDPEHLKEFDEAIKRGDHLNPKIKRNPKLFASYLNKLEKWPGLENAKDVSEFGRPWKGNLTGAHRSDIVKFMDKSYWRDRGFPEVGVTRAAITNPDLLGAGGNKLGYRVVKLAASQPQGGKSIFKHSTYPVDTFGEYMMDVPLVQRHYAQPDVIERLIRTPTKAGQVVHPYSEDPMGRSTARKLFEEQKQIQPINQRFIDSVMTGIENQEKYGLKKGGSVRKALMIAKTTKKK